MIVETGFLLWLSGMIAPTLAWRVEYLRKKKMELVYNIKVAQSLGHAATIRDHDTGAHNFRVTYMASILGEALGMDRVSLQGLMKGAFLHDVGKIGIPDRILLKNGPLDEEEWNIMKMHPILGVELVEQMPWFEDASSVILHHHEKFDGSGYPYGLIGENISLNARIFAIIDVFDALLAVRPYKKALTLNEAIEIINHQSGSHFDPTIVERFLLLAPEFATIIANNTQDELKAKLEARRKKIFGI